MHTPQRSCCPHRSCPWAEVKVQFSDLLGRALVFEQEVPQTGETVEVERYRPGTGFEVGLNLRF